MKTPIAAGLALAAVLLVSPPRANAQHHRVIAPTAVVAPVGGGTYGYSSGYAGAPAYQYSYYAVPNRVGPARGYVGFGQSDFPFYGQPYGHPYDPWTWPYMANNGRGLARYYDPPVK